MPNLRPPLDEIPVNTQVIQGAATPLDHRKRNQRKPTVKHWQHKAFDYYDEIPEVYYGANYIGNCMARIRLIGAEVPKNLGDAPKVTTNVSVAEAVKNFRNKRSGQSGLLRRSGQITFLAGEYYIHGQDNGDEQNWEIYSPIELTYDGTSYSLQNQSGEETISLPKNEMITRVWKEHPKRSFDPDSAMLTCKSQCEKLLILEKQDLSIARSRFAGAGLLLFPSEIVPIGQVDDEGNIDEDPSHSPFIQNIQNAMVEPILGNELPEDVVPSFIVGQADYLKQIRHITMEKPINAFSEEQKISAIRRMATAMDLPNEVLLGMADTNHWTAWQIKEETFQTHIRPFVEMMCNALTTAYLWPALEKIGVKDYKKYIIWYDDTNLVARPDKTQVAQKAYEGIAISAEAYRREYGFSEEDAPSEDEYNKRAGLSLRDPVMAKTGEPSTDQNNKHDANGPYAQDKSRPDPNLPGPAKSPIPSTTEAEKKVSSDNKLQASAAYTITEKEYGYLEACIDRALEKAGAKVRTVIPKNSELALYIKNYSNEEVYGKLDQNSKDQYGIKDSTFLDFSSAITYLESKGYTSTDNWENLKLNLQSETIRKASNKNGTFSLNLDKIRI